MDPAVCSWLTQHDLAELVPVFTRQKLVSFKRIKRLTEELLSPVIPEVGLRVEFMEALAELKAAESSEEDLGPLQGDVVNRSSVTALRVGQESSPEVDDPQPMVTDKNKRPHSTPLAANPAQPKRKRRIEGQTPRHVLSFEATEKLNALDFKIHLEEDIVTATVLRKYEVTGGLTEGDRASIVQAAARFLLTRIPVIGISEYVSMTKKICALFPDENPNIYFMPPDETCKNFGGKLAHKVKNIKYSLSKRYKSTVYPPAPATPSSKNNFTEPAKLAACDSTELSSSLETLAHASLDSWPRILELWSKTHEYRRTTLLSSRVPEEEDNFLDYNWDVLKASNGHLLLSQDFAELFPGRSDLLITQWSLVKKKIVTLARCETPKSDIETREILELIDNTSESLQDTLILALLPSLLCRRGRGNPNVHPTTPAQARRAFIIHIKTANDLSRQIRTHLTTLRAQHQRFQPCVVVVGKSLADISASYIQVDEETRYHVRTPIAAVDACFKSFFALDVQFPQQAYPVWLFIQRFFYNVYIEGDQNISRVDAVVSSLTGMTRKTA